MNETTKIKNIALQYCNGCGIDVACGSEKIKPEAIGIDASLGDSEFRDLSCVNIMKKIEDLSLFCSDSLDYVYSSHFLEHVKNPQAMLKEMSRVIRVEGYIVLYLPDRLLYTEDNPDHIHMWTLNEFKEIVPSSLSVVHEIAEHDYSFFIVLKKNQ